MGGKQRQGRIIAEYVRKVLGEEQWYVEPFCGALGVAQRVAHEKMVLADSSKSLITTWKAVQNPSLELPDTITEDEYQRLKKTRDPKDWMTAYAGFGVSFGGKWFGGYARNKVGTNFSRNLKRSVERKRDAARSATFVCADYRDLEIPPNSVVYCDPPYAKRTKAHDFKSFDHDEFWDWCRSKVAEGHVVLATEFHVPDGFVVLHSFGDTVVRHHRGRTPDGTVEVLLCHESQAHLFKGCR